MNNEAEKACTKCGERKPLSMFYKDKRASDGKASNCKTCHNVLTAAWAKAHVREMNQYSEKYRKEHPEKVAATMAAFRRANRKTMVAIQSRYAKAHPEKMRAKVAAYAKANRHKMNAKKALHEAQKIRATPAWADRKEIRRFYIEATSLSEQTGIRHEVDHIVPLRGKTVSGLHVPANLRVITKAENMKKGNAYWPDMP